MNDMTSTPSAAPTAIRPANPHAKSFAEWRALGPVGAVKAAFEALEQRDDPAIFITLRAKDDAMAQAVALEAAGVGGHPLFGLPFAVKDNIDVAGLPTTAACPAFHHIAQKSAHLVARLEAAGAICLGKTNLDQFATGLVGVRSPYGVPRNSLRDDLVPGGSSSGSAVAVGAGIAAFALGTDTAGSGRVPAALNGIAGLKPSLGLLSATGMLPACRTLDTISIFAAKAADAAAVAAIAQDFDPSDFMSRTLPQAGLGAVPPRLKVAVPLAGQRIFCGDALAKDAFERDIEQLAALGASIEAIDFEPFFAVARLLYEGPWVAERYHATRALLESNPDAMHPVTRGIIEGARRFNAVDAFDATYRLGDLKAVVAPVLARFDMLAVPTIPTIYTVAEVLADPVRLNSNLGTYTNFVNLLDMAAFSVPVGWRADGLPSSLTLIAPAGRDALLAGTAHLLETGERPNAANAAGGRIEVAVVGAHLSGMPLNHELTTRGGVFLREAHTSPDYALHALAGTVPPKPGLIRVAQGRGARIALEIWSLDAAAFGSFVAAIPSPLGIGTLRLDDGGSAKGFLVEAEALHGATDISSHGGWRAYLAARS